MAADQVTGASPEPVWKGILASTRLVRLRGEDRVVGFAREALEGMASQISQGFVPLNYEHLLFLPPVGRITTATVRVADDGESELHIEGHNLSTYAIVDGPDVLAIANDLPEIFSPELSIELNYTPRNFDEDVAREIIEDCGDIARPDERWAELPPLEFAILIPVVWGAAKFAGSLLGALGQATGEALVAKMGSWARRSKQPNRTVIFALKFQLPDGANVCGYVLASPDNFESAIGSVLEASEELAVIAGLQNQTKVFPAMKDAAFFFDEGQWHLGWWTDGESVFCTAWFEGNPPDIDGVLGR